MNDAPSPTPSDDDRSSPERERRTAGSATGAIRTDDPSAPPAEFKSISSIWPAVVAAGVTLTAFGIVTSMTFSIFGLLVFISGVIGWAGELIRG